MYQQRWHPDQDGLNPGDRAWWDGHIAANYRHARHFMRNARRWAHQLDALLASKAGVRRVRHALESLLFALDVVERARNDARYLRRNRDQRFS